MIPTQAAISSTNLQALNTLDQSTVPTDKVPGNLLVEDQAALKALENEATSSPTTPSTSTLPSNLFSVLKNVKAFEPALLSELEPSTTTTGTTTPTTGAATSGLGGVSDQIGSLSTQLQSDMTQLQNLNPNDPNYLQESTQLMMEIQNLQNQIQELTTMESNLLSSEHQTTMSIINNMKS